MEDETPPVERAIAAALERQAFPGLVSVHLFGSQAAGRAHRESDVDLAVFLDFARYPTARERFDAQLALFERFAGALARNDVDLVGLNDASPTLAHRI